MTMPASGTISISDIRQEFWAGAHYSDMNMLGITVLHRTGATTSAMSEYYNRNAIRYLASGAGNATDAGGSYTAWQGNGGQFSQGFGGYANYDLYGTTASSKIWWRYSPADGNTIEGIANASAAYPKRFNMKDINGSSPGRLTGFGGASFFRHGSYPNAILVNVGSSPGGVGGMQCQVMWSFPP